MKKFRIAAMLASAPLAAHAQTYTPVPMSSLAAQVAPIIASQNYAGVHIDQALLGSIALSQVYANQQGQISTVQATAQAAIPAAQKGAASGVAPLDANANVISPINAPAGNFNRTVSAGSASYTVPMVGLVGKNPDDLAGQDMVAFGGLTDTAGNTSSASVNIIGAPYSNYNAGTVLFLGDTNNNYTGGGGRAPVSETDWRSGGAQSVIDAGYFDNVAFEQFVDTLPARVQADVASYDATGLTLVTPMTNTQMAMLRPGMYVSTNSLASGASNSTATSIPSQNFYAGFLISWTSTRLNVGGWAVPGSGNAASGQIPTTNYDTYFSSLGKPEVWVGSPTKTFARNVYINIDTTKLGANPVTLNRRFEGAEEDYAVTGAAGQVPDGSIALHGLTLTALFRGGISPSVLSPDSYGLYIGGPFPDGIIVGEAGNDNVLRSGSTLIHGNEGVTSSRLTGVGFEHADYADGQDTFNLKWYLSKDRTDVQGYSAVSGHLGVLVDAAQGSVSTGSGAGELVWNPKGQLGGGFAACVGNNGATCEEYWNADGHVGIRQVDGVTAGNALTLGKQPSGYAAMIGAYAEDGYGNNLLDIEVGGSPRLTLNAGGSAVFAGGVQANTLSTLGIVTGSGFAGTSATGTELAQWYPTAAGDWQCGTSVSGGCSIRGVNSYYGSLMNLTGGITAGGAQINGSSDVTGNSTVGGFQTVQSEMVVQNGGTWTDNGLLVGTQPAGYVAAFGVYANAGYGHSLVDVEVGGVSKFLVDNAGNGTLAGSMQAKSFIGTLTTPASSSDTCAAGQSEDDANYHYVCVSTNTWKRVALSSF